MPGFSQKRSASLGVKKPGVMAKDIEKELKRK
jgi:hypothetical protein